MKMEINLGELFNKALYMMQKEPAIEFLCIVVKMALREMPGSEHIKGYTLAEIRDKICNNIVFPILKAANLVDLKELSTQMGEINIWWNISDKARETMEELDVAEPRIRALEYLVEHFKDKTNVEIEY